jgi:hypothetical protein
MNSEAGPTVPAAGSQSDLVGTWRLVSAETQNDQGVWVPYTFGNPPSGYFIYDATGHASIQIMTTPPVALSDPGAGPTPAEALEIFNNYIAYYGTWTAGGGTVTVMVEGAWDPTQVGTPQARPYQVSGDTLTIGNEAAGYIRTLKRVV